MFSFSASHPDKVPFRPLLPAAPPATQRLSLPPSRLGRVPKRTSVPVACEGCRRKKLKCSGKRPSCRLCIRRSTPCHYLAASSETHSQALKRKYDALLQRQALRSPHQELIEHLSSMSLPDATQVLMRLQAGQNPEVVLNSLKTASLLLQLHVVPETRLRYRLPYSAEMPANLMASSSPYLDSLIYEASWSEHPCTSSQYQSKYLKPYHSATLVEQRLALTKPSQWTNVSKDDELMKDLLAAYFMREYHLYPVFRMDSFLEDMTSGYTGCCSSILVNAVLAYACHCSTRIPQRFAYWDPQSLAYLFLAEAKRLWELQVSTSSHRQLTSVQAVMIIAIVYNACGLDKIGDLYGIQGFSVAREMGLFDGNLHIASRRLRDVANFTAWCLFSIDSHWAWQYHRVPILEYPPKCELPDPIAEAAWYGEVSIKYHSDQHLTSGLYGLFFKALCQARVIIHDICREAFEQDTALPWNQARALGKRLEHWYNQLPSAISARHMVFPGHFLLHDDYHMITLALYQPYKEAYHDDDFSPANAVHEAIRSLNIIMRLYFLRHSFEAIDIYILAPLTKLNFLSLEALKKATSSTELEDIRATLALVLVGLAYQSQHIHFTRAVFKLVKSLMPELEFKNILLKENLVEDSYKTNRDSVTSEVQSAWTPTQLVFQTT